MSYRAAWNDASYFWGRISTATLISLAGAGSATIDRMHVLTGAVANYTVTLPAAAGNAGRVLGFTCRFADVANPTLQVKLDAGVGTYIAGRTRYLVLLDTNVALFYSDGTNWIPLVLALDTPWVNLGAVDIRGSTTNPSKGTASTITDALWFRRSSNKVMYQYNYKKTDVGDDAVGSGSYSVLFPFDAAAEQLSVMGQGLSLAIQTGWSNCNIGQGFLQVGANSYPLTVFMGANSAPISLCLASNGSIWGQALGSLAAAVGVSFECAYPVADW